MPMTLTGAGRLWLPLAGGALALALLAGGLYLAYDHGRAVERAEWRVRWSDRDAGDTAARLKATETERAREQTLQHAINQVKTDAEQQIDTALTQAADAANAADGLRNRVEQLLAADRARRNTCTASSSAAAENPGNLLAVVLDKSVQRNRELAAVADAARIAGLACEAAYGALSGSPR